MREGGGIPVESNFSSLELFQYEKKHIGRYIYKENKSKNKALKRLLLYCGPHYRILKVAKIWRK